MHRSSQAGAGGPQELSRVGKWPGQPDQKGTTKIPSVLYYDSRENVRVNPLNFTRALHTESRDN